MSRGPDVGTQLVRALLASAADAGCPSVLVASDWTRWASATFTGARYAIELRACASPHLEAWLFTLHDAEFSLRGHLVADLVVTAFAQDGPTVTFRLEGLTVEER